MLPLRLKYCKVLSTAESVNKMTNRLNSKVFLGIEVLLAAFALVLLSIPAFNMIGLIIRPLLLCVVGGAVISFVLSFIPKGETVCGLALLLFVSFWAIFAVAKEIELQFLHGFPGKWIEFFYFDKLLMVGTIWLSSSAVFIFKRLIVKHSSKNYKSFFKLSSAAFIIFYSFLLVYSFVLIRLERGVYPLNWIPFNTIKDYISDYSSIPYEVFMMFFGNLLYFTPLGVICYLLLKKHKFIVRIPVITLFPLVAFSLLEYSQYLFQNGFCEFDDMMMNSVGFWFGALFGFIADTVVKKVTNGSISCFWD